MSQALFSQQVYLPNGPQAATLRFEHGRITAIEAGQQPDAEDLGHAVIMPGLIDPHVHVNEPGRTEWEGFYTATRAAAAGGVTTLVDMPLNSDPVTTTQQAFADKREAAQGQCWINVGFWGGVIPGNKAELAPLIQDGLLGFKAFLIHSGIDDFPHSDAATLRAAMPILKHYNVPLLVHAELEGEAPEHTPDRPQSYQDFLHSRPRDWEDRAIELMIELCRESQCHTHIVHLSSSTALPSIAAARAEGLPFSVETCPHYLYFAAETIPDGRPEYKCMPPIREQENQDALWQGLRDGHIDCVVTDHSPCIPGLKLCETGDVLHAWGGIASLQLGLPSVWTQARKRGFTLQDLIQWMAVAPARFIGMENRKGQLKVGFDADIVVWEPDSEFTVSPELLHFKNKLTPYQDKRLMGWVQRSYVGGQLVYAEGEHQGPQGGFLLRS